MFNFNLSSYQKAYS